MFLNIDYKVNNSLRGIASSLYSSLTLPKHNKSKMIQVLQSLSYNCLRSVRFSSEVFSISLDSNTYVGVFICNGVRVDRNISYSSLLVALRTLEEAGYLFVSRAEQIPYNKHIQYRKRVKKGEDVVMSSITFLSKFIDLIKDVNYNRVESVLELRGKDSNPVRFPSTDFSRDKIKLYNSLNLVYSDTAVALHGENLYMKAKKIFNESFDQGGRGYLMEGSVQTLSQMDRSKITIDGDPVVELDYDSNHFSIIACLEGYIFEEGFDPYTIPNPNNLPKGGFRKVCKDLLMIAVNASSPMACTEALLGKMEDDEAKLDRDIIAGGDIELTNYRYQGIRVEDVNLWEILKELKKRNPYTEGWINSGKGGELQRIDSDIADCVIRRMLDEDIAVIPIHDSFIVAEQHENTLGIAMIDSWEEVLGTVNNCGVSKK